MSFFKKLKDLPDFQEEPQNQENQSEEHDDFELQKLTASIDEARKEEAPKKEIKRKPKKAKKIIIEAKNTQPVIQETSLQTVSQPQNTPATPKQDKSPEKKWPEPEGQLATDVYETETEIIIQTAVAGVKPGNLDITAQGDIVVIKGRRDNPRKEEKKYFYQECYWGAFSREIILPAEADTSRTEATMVDGILTIKIPKIGKDKVKKIVI